MFWSEVAEEWEVAGMFRELIVIRVERFLYYLCLLLILRLRDFYSLCLLFIILQLRDFYSLFQLFLILYLVSILVLFYCSGFAIYLNCTS